MCVSVHLPLWKRGNEGDLSNQISPNPSFPKRGTERYQSVGAVFGKRRGNKIRLATLKITYFCKPKTTQPYTFHCYMPWFTVIFLKNAKVITIYRDDA